MTTRKNHLGQPIGAPLENWTPPPLPPRVVLTGRVCRLEPLDASRHARDLFAANSLDAEGRQWTYLPYGPFEAYEPYRAWVAHIAAQPDPMFYAIIPADSGKAAGVASLMRIDPKAGSIEVGHIKYSPLLQQHSAATKAMYLLMKHAFELGYRRYEWKCDSLNEPSRRAALRLGFQYEGRFRQATSYKGRNRDTDWFSILDSEWPRVRAAFERWLEPGNFDGDGRQRERLGAARRAGREFERLGRVVTD